MAIRAVVFDMDGTLLHTMPDLARAANEAFARMGFPEKTQDQMLAHMGLGGQQLIERIIPEEAGPDVRQEAFDLWRALYIQSDYALTEPFEGMVDAVRAIRALGVKTAILSNKFDEGARKLAELHFPGLFDVVQGDAPPLPRKPDAASLLRVLDMLGVGADEAVYVGDTIVDVQTAHNAGVACVGVSWGYDAAAPLPKDELAAFVREPAELAELLEM